MDGNDPILDALIAGTQDDFSSEILLALVVGAIIYFAFFSGGGGWGGGSGSGSNDNKGGRTKKKKKRPPEPYTSLEVRALPATSSLCSTQKCLAAVMTAFLWPSVCAHLLQLLLCASLSLYPSPHLPHFPCVFFSIFIWPCVADYAWWLLLLLPRLSKMQSESKGWRAATSSLASTSPEVTPGTVSPKNCKPQPLMLFNGYSIPRHPTFAKQTFRGRSLHDTHRGTEHHILNTRYYIRQANIPRPVPA